MRDFKTLLNVALIVMTDPELQEQQTDWQRMAERASYDTDAYALAHAHYKNGANNIAAERYTELHAVAYADRTRYEEKLHKATTEIELRIKAGTWNPNPPAPAIDPDDPFRDE